jgi:hypothetical protein
MEKILPTGAPQEISVDFEDKIFSITQRLEEKAIFQGSL